MTRPPSDRANKRWIKPLPKQLINKIAAGEVVERPASVLKELVENSIDAGSERIEIIIEKSGAKLIKIVDDGCGIDEEQIEVAFARHATSKISSFDDIHNLLSYGFRGEALPSIASVSRLRMVSRPHDAQSGTEIIFEGGVIQHRKPIAAPVGTSIEVENLFYNTPARRKFLKAESTEARHIARVATALAIGRPDIGFTFTLNGRKVFSRPPGESLAERVAGVLGDRNKKFVVVAGHIGPVAVAGLVSTPQSVQQSRSGQFLFINNRYISSPTLSHAFNAGYGELLPRGQHPVGALLLSVDPTEVDVNVHPAKTEVRLSREREIHDAVCRIVKDALRHDGIIPSIRTAAPDRVPGEPPVRQTRSGSSSGGERHTIPGIGRQPVNTHLLSELYRSVPAAGGPAKTDDIIEVDKRTGEIITVETAAPSASPTGPPTGFRFIGRFADMYLLLQTGDDLYVVDQHTAHERVLYEEILEKIERHVLEGQRLLFPVQVELTPEQMVVFEESNALLNSSGFQVGPFGGRMVNIEAVPVVLAKKSAEKVLLKVLDDIASLRKTGHDLKKAMAQAMACRSAVMAGDRLDDREAVHLVERLLRSDNAYSCPHGRPTFIKLSRADLDRQFGRG